MPLLRLCFGQGRCFTTTLIMPSFALKTYSCIRLHFAKKRPKLSRTHKADGGLSQSYTPSIEIQLLFSPFLHIIWPFISLPKELSKVDFIHCYASSDSRALLSVIEGFLLFVVGKSKWVESADERPFGIDNAAFFLQKNAFTIFLCFLHFVTVRYSFFYLCGKFGY